MLQGSLPLDVEGETTEISFQRDCCKSSQVFRLQLLYTLSTHNRGQRMPRNETDFPQTLLSPEGVHVADQQIFKVKNLKTCN